MGCSCSGKTISCVKIEENADKKEFNEDYQPNSTVDSESCEIFISIAVWASSEILLNTLFPKPLMKIRIDSTHSMKINLVPYTSTNSLIKDALLFLSDQKSDKSKIIKICSENPKICEKFLICPNLSIKLENSLITTVMNAEHFLSELKNRYFSLEHTLRSMFADIDKDRDGLISLRDLTTSKLNSQCTESEIQNYFNLVIGGTEEKMDLDHFINWWKRGRQGALPFHSLINSCLQRISKYFPHVFRDPDQINIKKNKIQKKISMNNFDQVQSNFHLSILVGNGAKKEEILREVTEVLNLHIYEFWVCFQLKYNSGVESKHFLHLYNDLIESLKITLCVNTSSIEELKKGVVGKVVCKDNLVYFGFAFDVGSDAVEQGLEFVEKVNELLKSPTDDYFELRVNSENSIMTKQDSISLIESLKDTDILIQGEHWDNFSDFFQKNSQIDKLIKKFLDLNGTIELNSTNFSGFPSLKFILDQALHPIKHLLSLDFFFTQILSQLGQDLSPEFSILSRIGDYGLSISLSDTKLKDLLIISN